MFSLTPREVWSFSLHSMYGSDMWRFWMNDNIIYAVRCALCWAISELIGIRKLLRNVLYSRGKYVWGVNLESCWSSGCLVCSEIMYKKDILKQKAPHNPYYFLTFVLFCAEVWNMFSLIHITSKSFIWKENEKVFHLVLEINQFSESPFLRYWGGPDSCWHLHKCGHG